MKKSLTGVLILIAVAATAAVLLTVVPLTSCPGCSGEGQMSTLRYKGKQAYWTEPCSDCGSRGRLSPVARWSVARRMHPCIGCEGSGMIPAGQTSSVPCEWCFGTGKTTNQREVQIKRYADSASQ